MQEFDFIATLLAPLAAREPGALGLKDDAALLNVPAGKELVITKDAMSEGVHFIGDEPAELIARKFLRVNLSDLAAMGAEPWGYLLALLLPEKVNDTWLRAFAAGLKQDQEAFNLTLLGGDTTRIKGPLTLSVTALGLVPQGEGLKRQGAKSGDGIYVSGTLGDAALGLEVAKSSNVKDSFLLERYRLPEPRLKLGQGLRGIATSHMDISDGLMQDLGHICTASGVGAVIEAQGLPVSPQAQAALKTRPNPYDYLLAGGDDYELLFTVPENKHAQAESVAKNASIPITRIGSITQSGLVKALDAGGKEISLKHPGYTHF